MSSETKDKIYEGKNIEELLEEIIVTGAHLDLPYKITDAIFPYCRFVITNRIEQREKLDADYLSGGII